MFVRPSVFLIGLFIHFLIFSLTLIGRFLTSLPINPSSTLLVASGWTQLFRSFLKVFGKKFTFFILISRRFRLRAACVSCRGRLPLLFQRCRFVSFVAVRRVVLFLKFPLSPIVLSLFKILTFRGVFMVVVKFSVVIRLLMKIPLFGMTVLLI